MALLCQEGVESTVALPSILGPGTVEPAEAQASSDGGGQTAGQGEGSVGKRAAGPGELWPTGS